MTYFDEPNTIFEYWNDINDTYKKTATYNTKEYKKIHVSSDEVITEKRIN